MKVKSPLVCGLKARDSLQSTIFYCFRICTFRYSGLLTLADFEIIDPHRALFLRQLSSLAAQRRSIESDSSLTDDQKQDKIKTLTFGNSQALIDDLGYDSESWLFLFENLHNIGCDLFPSKFCFLLHCRITSVDFFCIVNYTCLLFIYCFSDCRSSSILRLKFMVIHMWS